VRTFEESLARVLDPENYFWKMLEHDTQDADRERMVEIRFDIPGTAVEAADASMQKLGWQLTSRPDAETDILERLFWRKSTAIRHEDKIALLTSALKVAHETQGTLVSWINVEELGED
jgi:hypothetical protein